MAMNIFNNNRTVFWILIFLVMINIAALVTYFVYSRKTASQPIPATEFKQGIALRQELSLAPDQSLKVNTINAGYQATSEPIIKAIRDKKSELLQELTKDNTDTILVAKLVDEVGSEQKKLQQTNVKQFLDLKKVCTPEQTQKLSQIYAELYGCDRRGQGKGNGNGMRYRHRYGQQQTHTTKLNK
jgi:Spy/CpxP family protein refolding chaperone